MCVLRIEGRFMKTFFIPFLTWLSLKIQLLHVKSRNKSKTSASV